MRRSAGVLTVCAALEDVAHGHAPRHADRAGGGHHAARPGGARRAGRHLPAEDGRVLRSRCTWAIWSTTRASTCCSKGSATRWTRCTRPGWSSWEGGQDDIARYGARAAEPGHPQGGALPRAEAGVRARRSPARGGRAGLAAAQGAQHPDEDLFLPRLRYRGAGHPAPDPHPGAGRSDRLPGGARADGPRAPGSPRCSRTTRSRKRLAARAKDHVQREFTPEAARRKLEIVLRHDRDALGRGGVARVKQLWRSPTIRSAAVYGAAGAGSQSRT